MSYAFIQDVPANEEIYRQVSSRLGEASPAGLVAHIVMRRDDGLRMVEVWESEQAWQTFHDEMLWPALSAVLAGVGVQPDPTQAVREAVDVVDVWVPGPAQVPAG
jgi:hypothetical protein